MEESFLFSDTVRANIAYGRPDATDEQVMAAARAAQAHEFIVKMPKGYDTVVGEQGLTLSGGQRQAGGAGPGAGHRPPPAGARRRRTSAIDPRLEAEIHAALRAVMQGRTTLIIAHRRSTLNLADRIVVLDAGRVADSGTHTRTRGALPAVPAAHRQRGVRRRSGPHRGRRAGRPRDGRGHRVRRRACPADPPPRRRDGSRGGRSRPPRRSPACRPPPSCWPRSTRCRRPPTRRTWRWPRPGPGTGTSRCAGCSGR